MPRRDGRPGPDDIRDVPNETVAAAFGVGVRQANVMRVEGILPRSRVPGHHDLVADIRAYVTWKLRGGAGDAPTAAEINRQRLAESLRIERVKANVAEERYVPRDEVERALAATMTTIATALDGLGGRLAAELAGISDPATIRKRLLDETRKIRADAAARLRGLAAERGGGQPP